MALPTGAVGQYVVMIGRAASERINSDGAITGLPSLYGFMMNFGVKVADASMLTCRDSTCLVEQKSRTNGSTSGVSSKCLLEPVGLDFS